MHPHLYVLTGASRGLGAALAQLLLRDAGNHLLCISRRVNELLPAHASASGARLEQWPLDLAQPLEAAARVEAWLGAHHQDSIASATLINNAAALTKIGPLDAVEPDELSRALRVGLEAPLLLCGAFLRATRGWRAERKLLNISSGLGRRAMASQAPYCAIKAGLDHASRVIAIDEARHADGARIVSIAPGVIDTDMQTQMRGADPRAFPDHALFVQLKSAGRLASPQGSAAQLLAFLRSADFGSNVIADVRES